MGIGRTYLRLHQPRQAVTTLERACKLRESLAPVLLARCRFRLATALLSEKGSEARVRHLAQQARAVFLLDPEQDKEALTEIRKWLARP
jgi:hypothetical protein